MKMRESLGCMAFLLAALSGQVGARQIEQQTSPDPVEIEAGSDSKKRQQDPRTVARQILGPAGQLYREVRYPTDQTIYFAGVPRPAGFTGLCVADTAFVTVARKGSTKVEAVEGGRLFRVVDDPLPGAEIWDAAYEARMKRLCDQAGPVFAETAQAPGFFGLLVHASDQPKAVYAAFAARVLTLAIRASDSGAGPTIRCDEDPARQGGDECGSILAGRSQLSLKSLIFATVEPCTATKANLCVSGAFAVPANQRGEARYLELSVETNSARVDPPPELGLVSIKLRILTVAE